MTDLTIAITTHASRKHPDCLSGKILDQALESYFKTIFFELNLGYIEIHFNHHNDHISDKYLNVVQRLTSSYGLNAPIVNYYKGFKGFRCNFLPNSKYLLLLEHDWVFNITPPLAHIITQMNVYPEINYIRFNKRANVVTRKKTATGRWGADLFLKPVEYPIPLLASPNYSNNPHIERVSKLRQWAEIAKKSNVYAGKNGGAGGFEQPIQEAALDYYEEHGKIEFIKHWGTYIYGKLNDPAAVTHIGHG